jgi:1,4-alpha-glucan branching enzyme
MLDWVPAHFPEGRLRAAPLRRHGALRARGPAPRRAPRLGHADLQLRPHEVRNFLVANALYWLASSTSTACASMPWPRCSTSTTAATPASGCPTATAAARTSRPSRSSGDEPSSPREVPGVRHDRRGVDGVAGRDPPVAEGGLGFTFKWNMGWMHDTLTYFHRDPVHRRFHHNELTFAMLYEYSERFVNPLSTTRSCTARARCSTRCPATAGSSSPTCAPCSRTRCCAPGKALLFMGTELAPEREWNADTSLDWHLVRRQRHRRNRTGGLPRPRPVDATAPPAPRRHRPRAV